uniref:3-phosphoinositide-dependent protein kinase 1 n=1 Tax=Cyprinus carpio TaxID=7962 RepID=A0A8C2H153_CYPCA
MSESVSCLLSVCVLPIQYDAAPIQPSVVLCSCGSSSMVKTQLNSNLPHCLSMEIRGGEASVQEKTSTIKPPQSRKKEDFSFGKILGEGSFSTVGKFFVLVARMSEDFAKKMLVMDIFDFALSYAKNGELLRYIRKIGSFDETCTRFYTAEIVCALEYLHAMGIIHRDLKPENILLSEDMHIQITDFGTAKQLSADSVQTRANSFVGTAQYVSPELLTEKSACKSSDLWALGCIIYQLVAGLPPFRAGNEYLIFQKIIKLEYEFPEKFFPKAKDLVQRLLSLDPRKRLGCEEMGGFNPLKGHTFFETISWENLPVQTPPKLTPYLPAMAEDDEDYYGNYEDLLSQFSSLQVVPSSSSQIVPLRSCSNIEQYVHDLDSNSFELDLQFSSEEKRLLLQKQTSGNPWHQFVENNLIYKMGPVDKRKGLFARRRQLLLTEGPHLYYVDPVNKILKGEIPWSPELRPEAKNFKTFFVHTPNRTYYLMDPSGNADKWCKKIQEVWGTVYH